MSKDVLETLKSLVLAQTISVSDPNFEGLSILLVKTIKELNEEIQKHNLSN